MYIIHFSSGWGVFFASGFCVVALLFYWFWGVACLQRWDCDDAGFASFQDKPTWMELFRRKVEERKPNKMRNPILVINGIMGPL